MLLKKQVQGPRNPEDPVSNSVSASGDVKSEDSKVTSPQPNDPMNLSTNDPGFPRHPSEHVEEVMALLKTAFPLLALTLETMVDQILQRLKPTTDEDIYRLIVALLNDGVQMYMQQLARDPSSSGQLSTATEMNLLRFAESMNPNHIKVFFRACDAYPKLVQGCV